MTTSKQPNFSSWWAAVPLPLFLVAIVGLYLWGSPLSHESGGLLLVLNVLFTTTVSLFIATLAGRTFLITGSPTLLAICISMTVWGASALVAVIGEHVGNYNITIHNLGVTVSALCHLLGALATRHLGERPVQNTGAWLSVGVATALCTVGAIWMSTSEGWLPTFYIEGIGGTNLRTAVLIVAIALFAVSATLTFESYRNSPSRFSLWYSLGLATIAVGGLGLILQPTHGSWLGWVARSAQYLGGVYMLVGVVITARGQGNWHLSLEERLIRSERVQREQADLIRTINDNTNDLIFMKDRMGRITYANAATLRLLSVNEVTERTSERDLFPVSEEYEAITENDALVVNTGKTIEIEEVFTGADGIRRTFLSTKTPLRDEQGQIIGVVGVSRDVTERIQAQHETKRALAAAQVASEALRNADARKNEFLAILAHELRNPLAPLRNIVEIVKRSNGNEGILQQAIAMMDRQINQLGRLVDDLVDINRITQNRLELRKDRVELSSILRQSLEANRPLVDSNKHHVTISLPPDPIFIDGDSVRLIQLFSNIIHNACKYTEPGGHIEISVEPPLANQVAVRIKDDGLGIPPSDLQRIFDMFTQVERTLERSQGGLGIGLNMVKRLAELHGGTISAHSGGIGTGSEFVVRLPALVDAAEPQQSLQSQELTGSGHKFLVVDDNRDAASSLSMLLTIDGHITATAYDGEEAVRVAKSFRPHFVLLDIGLPTLNGYETCRLLRALPFGNDLFIVALTGWGQDEDRLRSKDAGFDQHMVKPLDYDALKTLLTSRHEQLSKSFSAAGA